MNSVARCSFAVTGSAGASARGQLGIKRSAPSMSGCRRAFTLSTRRQRQSQLRAVMHMGQAQYLRHVEFHRIFGNPQFAGDLIVGQALANQACDFQLPWRQLVEVRGDCFSRLCGRSEFRLAKVTAHLVQIQMQLANRLSQKVQLLVHLVEFSAIVHALLQVPFKAPDRSANFIHIDGFLIEVCNARPHCRNHILGFGLTRENDRFELAITVVGLLQRIDQADAILARKMQIAEHNADLRVRAEQFDRFVRAVTTNADVATVIKKLAKFFNDIRFVVHDEEFYHALMPFHVSSPGCFNFFNGFDVVLAAHAHTPSNPCIEIKDFKQ